MALTLPGQKLYENSAALAVGAPAVLTPFMDTTGYTTLLLSYIFTNSTGTTTMTVEGSFDGVTLDSTNPYAALPASPQAGATVIVMHTYVRIRIVQATAPATVSTVYVQSRA